MGPQPRRILLVSATIGEGHNATARAIEETVGFLWPECVVRWVDTLEVMGRWVPSTFRWIYTTNVESTPWLYEFFYSALWRWRWFADACRGFVGAWSGRRLRRQIANFRPDLVISTYPMGTAGLDWLRRRGELDIPIAAVVSDFSPHPFWIYPEVDLHYVMSTDSVREAQRAVPEAAIKACAPPVLSAFRPTDQAAARRAFGLPETGFLVLVSCGSMGFGSVERAVDTALGVAAVAHVVVVCAHNDALHRRLTARDQAGYRLRPLGWVEDMATLTGCADVVLTNAGGATALEALACDRTVVMFEPIAAHGRANAELMARSGSAELCRGTDDLRETLTRCAADPSVLATQRAQQRSTTVAFPQHVADLARLPRSAGRRVLQPQDSFFVHVARDVPQHAGAVLRLDGGSPRSLDDWREHLTELLTSRVPELPMLHHRIIQRPGHQPVWTASEVDHHEHVRCSHIRTQRYNETLAEFFSAPLRLDRPPWELLLLRDIDTGHVNLLVKMHHALGDGLAVTSTLLALLGDDPTPPEHADRRPQPHRGRRGQGREFVRGLRSLTTSGTAPATGLKARSTPTRRFAWVEFPSANVLASAHTHGMGSTGLLLATIAEALYRHFGTHTGTNPGQLFRVMVPRTARTTRTPAGADFPGNRTAALAVDLPIGPMPSYRRATEVAARLNKAKRANQSAVAGTILAGLGSLPAPLHAWTVRRIYQGRFFSAIVSVLPGPQCPPRIAGADIAKVFPVLPLADGVGLAIGAIRWGGTVGLGLTADPGLMPDVEELATHLHDAFTLLQTSSSGRGTPP